MIKVSATFDHRGLDKFARNFPRAVQSACDKSALMCQGAAQDAAPVDTGAYKASIHSQTSKNDGSALAICTAINLRPRSAPETDTTPLKKFEARTIAGASYSIYIEYGARGIPGNFGFTKAIAATTPSFFKMLRDAAGGNYVIGSR